MSQWEKAEKHCDSHVLRKKRQTGREHSRSLLQSVFFIQNNNKNRIKAFSVLMGDSLGPRLSHKLSTHIYYYVAAITAMQSLANEKGWAFVPNWGICILLR